MGRQPGQDCAVRASPEQRAFRRGIWASRRCSGDDPWGGPPWRRSIMGLGERVWPANGRSPGRHRWCPLPSVLEFSLAGLATLLGWLFGINPFRGLAWHDLGQLLDDIVCGGLAVVPLLGMFYWLRTSRLAVFRQLRQLLYEQILPHFTRASRTELAWLSLAAGIGEELLFRGFTLSAFQAHLDPQVLGGWLPLILSSVLFGLVHCVSWTYLVLGHGRRRVLRMAHAGDRVAVGARNDSRRL